MQRVGIAQALIGNPEVLILDEPTVGLDPKQIIEIRTLIGELKKEHTIILSSHVLPEVSAICERVIIINDGTIVAEDTPEELSKKMIGDRYMLSVFGNNAKTEAVLSSLTCVKSFEKTNSESEYAVVFSGDSLEARKLLSEKLSAENVAIVGLKPVELTLEEIFVKLTSDYEKEAAQ